MRAAELAASSFVDARVSAANALAFKAELLIATPCQRDRLSVLKVTQAVRLVTARTGYHRGRPYEGFQCRRRWPVYGRNRESTMTLQSLGLPELILLALAGIGVFYFIKKMRTLSLVIVGVILGAFVGFLMRPTLPIIGQLPADTVMARGTNLTGLNTIERSTAEESFNYVMIGAIVGGALFALARIARGPRTEHAVAMASGPGVSIPVSSDSRFCTKCGKPVGSDAKFCGACGAQR